MRYYRLMDELNNPVDRWFLKYLNVVEEKKISVWEFLSPARVKLPDLERLNISIRQEGQPLDFTFADFEVLVVNERVAYLLDDGECQLIPVEIKGIKNGHSYFIAVLLNKIECLDEARSKFEKWLPNDLVRPDLAGEYKSIYKLYIDPSKIKGNTIFRLDKSENIIIVNENIKKLFEKNGITGVKFRDIT